MLDNLISNSTFLYCRLRSVMKTLSRSVTLNMKTKRLMKVLKFVTKDQLEIVKEKVCTLERRMKCFY